MASGRTHAAVTVVASTLIAASAIEYGPTMLPVSIGCMIGLIINNDLDVDGVTHSEALVRRNVGGLIGALWFLLWYVYARWIPHRDWKSHAPVVSTIIRLMYLTPLFLLAYLVAEYYLPGLAWPFLIAHQANILLGIVGLIISDSLHTLFDTRLITNIGREIVRVTNFFFRTRLQY